MSTSIIPARTTAALRNVSLKIHAGEHVAMLGRVGSGKTTLEKLILGLYQPTAGAVLVDGVDLRQLDPAELRRNIGYVPQDVMLFYGSLRDNLTISSPTADDAAVLRAAAGGRPPRVRQQPPPRLRHDGGRARRIAFRRAAPGAWPSRAPSSTTRRSC